MNPLPIIKNHRHETRLFQRRLLIITILIAILALFLVARLAYLQVKQHKFYSTLSSQNHLALLPIEPKRGLIFDRNGILIAENKPVYSLDVLPRQLKAFQAELPALKKIVPISKDDLQQFHKAWQASSHLQPVPLEFNLTPKEVAKFYLNQYRLPALAIDARLIRHYPLGATLTSVLGYMGRINAQDLQEVDVANYSASNFIGKSGIEKYYEDELHGKIGYNQVEVDATGHVMRVLKRIPPQSGTNLYLTIDSALQKVAQKALGKEHGAVIVIEPKTGEVLALVSNPSFDPNPFVTGISLKDYRALANSPAKPMYNRALRGQFPPGSTIKPFLALEGLDSGLINVNYTINDPGWFRLPNTDHIYRDWIRAGHGQVNVVKAIIVSCDTFFYNLAMLLGINKIDAIMHDFGFGGKTGIDLSGELTGNVASPAWKMRYLGLHWYKGDTIISGIGQGSMLVTPVQLAYAVAIIANRGLRLVPHLLLKTKTAAGFTNTMQPVTATPITLKNSKNWDIIIKAMQGVVTSVDPWGTARIRFGGDPDYTIAAKTGTAQLYRHYVDEDQASDETKIPKRLRNDSVFIAFAPVKQPKIAIAVVVENSMIAGTVARKVMDYYLLVNKKSGSMKNQVGD